MRVLVVGATGILRPAAESLAAGGDMVHALARGAAAMPHVVPIAVDYTDEAALESALHDQPRFDAALLYCPGAPAASVRALADRVDGTIVELLTSRHADPAVHDADPERLDSVGVPLLLGWTADAPHRWHEPAEVSAAAVAVLHDPRPAVLGVVRPWSERPS